MEVCRVYTGEFKKGDKLVVFTREGCPYCKEAIDFLMKVSVPESMAQYLPEEVVEVSIDECNNFADEYDITSVPTFIRMVEGKEVGRVEGLDEEGIRWLITIDTQYTPKEEDEEEGFFLEDVEESAEQTDTS